MRRRAKLGWALGILSLAAIACVAAPIVAIETACRGPSANDAYRPVITEAAWQRPESRTFLTYPEWHMVYAYEDFAKVVETGDEHAFAFWGSVASFWTSFCVLNRQAAAHGGADGPTRQMIYTIGTSFNLEMAAKAAYEETIGRLAAWLRGPVKTPQDQVAAAMARDYAAFLHQTPWYRFRFVEWTQKLAAAPGSGFRSWERGLALSGEWEVKQAYADLIARAVAATGPDELRIRSVVRDLAPDRLAAIPGIAVVAALPDGVVVDSNRYAAFTALLRKIATAGGTMFEIAGNDDIMVSVRYAPGASLPGDTTALHTFDTPADGEVRTLVLTKVSNLSPLLRGEGRGGYRVEHVFDY